MLSLCLRLPHIPRVFTFLYEKAVRSTVMDTALPRVRPSLSRSAVITNGGHHQGYNYILLP